MELYNANEMPLSNNPKRRNIQEKVLRGEQLGPMDAIYLGRDRVVKEINGYKLKPDHCYRAVSQELYDKYMEFGFIYGNSKDDEYQEYEENGQTFNNNRGVDWYLGGAAPRYGDIIIECPADKEYFVPAFDNGSGMAMDPTVRFLKSSGYKKPIPISMITNVFDMEKIRNREETEGRSR